MAVNGRSGPGRSLAAVFVAAAVAAVAFVVVDATTAGADGPTTFSNTTAMAIPATGSANQIGPASPYPSNVTVSGMTGLVTNVTVTLNGLTHGSLNDVDVLLVAPGGQNLVVLSDIGDPQTALALASNATYTFSDAAAGPVPAPPPPTIPGGTYRPTNNGTGDTFPSPAPSPSSQTTLAGAFSGISPNGTWSLYVVDDTSGDVGSMGGGWSLTVTTATSSVATTTAVSTSGSPSATGSPVTFTATVTASGSPVTTGTVQFAVDGTPLGAAVALSATGTAQLQTSTLVEGTHTVTATYSGASGFLTSNGSVSQRVDNATTVSGNTFCNTGQITVPSVGPAQPYPSHITVSGLSGATTKVTVALSGVGHAVPVDLDVMLVAPGGANLMLLSDAGGQTPVSGANLVFDDAAGSGVTSPLATGTYRPTDDDSGGGTDAFPAPAPATSAATTLATFNGLTANGQWSLFVNDDATADAGSITGGWCLTVSAQAATTTTLTSDNNPSTVGESVTFTATVTSPSGPVSAGTVTFDDGGTPLGAAIPPAGGTATFTTSTLTEGTHTITATYSGATGLAGSDNTLTQVVQLTPTTLTLTSDANPSIVGQSVTFTATATTSSGPVSGGTVTFDDGGTPLGAAITPAADGTATLTTSTLTEGTHTITATYSGATGLAGSDNTLTQVVQLTPTTLTLTSDANPSIVGQPVTFTATVTSPFGPITVGTVTFDDGGSGLATPVPLAGDGTATLTTSTLTEGTHTITATYSGATGLAGSDNTLTQVVQLTAPPADPTAGAGGPYSVAEGQSLTLTAAASAAGSVYEWDLDGDGELDDASGPSPTLTWASLEALGIDDGPGSFTVSLRVTLNAKAATATTTLTVTNTAPASVVTGALTATVGEPFTIKIGADDPSSADMAATFVYTADWGDGSPIDTVSGPADPPLTHTYASAGSFSASFTATDKDGGTGAPTAVVVRAVRSGTPTQPTTPTTPAEPSEPTGPTSPTTAAPSTTGTTSTTSATGSGSAGTTDDNRSGAPPPTTISAAAPATGTLPATGTDASASVAVVTALLAAGLALVAMAGRGRAAPLRLPRRRP